MDCVASLSMGRKVSRRAAAARPLAHSGTGRVRGRCRGWDNLEQ
jgi:hypothetical protein